MENERMEPQELQERLKLIGDMIAEGRRTTERWGWSFVLWGVAYFVATAWISLTRNIAAWPVTMVAAGVITATVAARMSRNRPETTLGRALGAIWSGMGISLFVLLMSLSWSGRYELHVFVAIVGAMLATANGVSAILLRWKAQFGCALVWLASSVAACFGSAHVTGIAFLAATFLCQIAFGVYVMIREARRQPGAVHA